MIWELLISFPVNILWGILLFQAWERPYGKIGVYVVTGILLVVGFFVPDRIALFFWDPSGIITIVFGGFLHLLLVKPNESLKKVLLIDLPSRKAVKDILMKTPDVEERQKAYVKIIREYSAFWKEKSNVLTEINTKYNLAIFLSIGGLLFLFWLISYFFNPEIIGMLKSQFEMLNKNIARIAESAKDHPIDIPRLFGIYISLAPTVIFMESTIVFLFFLYVLRKIFAGSGNSMVILGYLSLFKMNENVVWGFIAAGAVTWGSFYYPLPEIMRFVGINTTAILAFLFMLQGVGTLHLFLTVRLLPASWIIFTVFALGIFIPQAILLFIFLLTAAGLGDFWFDFRNKALQPRAIYDNDDY